MAASDGRTQLIQARELIRERRFAEARTLLRSLPQNPTAREWLAKLDALAPERPPATPPSPPASDPDPRPDWLRPVSPPAPASQSAAQAPHPPAQTVAVSFALNLALVRYAVAVTIGLLALLMIVGFFVFTWMDMGKVSFFGFDLQAFGGEVDSGPLKVTPLELWIGRNDGEPFIVDLQDVQGSFADVRLIDRTLILLPIAGVLLLWLVWGYLTPGPEGKGRVSALALIGLVAFIVLVYPFVWQDLSDRALEDSVRDSMALDVDEDLLFFDLSLFTGFLTQTYSTGEYALLGGLALTIALGGLAVELFSVPRPVPRAS